MAPHKRLPSFDGKSTAEEVTKDIDASRITAIVTGGASGLGLETSKVLLARGARVIVGARDLEKANAAIESILVSNPTAKLEVMQLDLNSTSSVRNFANAFLAKGMPLNLLINNAGIMMIPFELSDDGIEKQFATNHLGHFLLTNLLLNKMKETVKECGIQGRIINLSSVAHTRTYKEGICFDIDKLNDQTNYNDLLAYGHSKLANILHANELARQLQAENVNITVNSVHPGIIWSPLWKHSSQIVNIVTRGLGFFKESYKTKSLAQGAATTCFVALHPNVREITGKYFVDCKERKPSNLAMDMELARKLWEFSGQLIEFVSS